MRLIACDESRLSLPLAGSRNAFPSTGRPCFLRKGYVHTCYFQHSSLFWLVCLVCIVRDHGLMRSRIGGILFVQSVLAGIKRQSRKWSLVYYSIVTKSRDPDRSMWFSSQVIHNHKGHGSPEKRARAPVLPVSRHCHANAMNGLGINTAARTVPRISRALSSCAFVMLERHQLVHSESHDLHMITIRQANHEVSI